MNSATQPGQMSGGCALCGATNARELYTARDALSNSGLEFSIAECDGCGVLRTLPEMTEHELTDFYPEVYWGEDDEPSQAWIRRSQSEKLRFLSRCGLTGGRILDVGCGAGFFLRALNAAKWDRWGIEIAAAAARLAGPALGSDHVFNGTLTRAQFHNSNFSVITFWSSLEHTNQPRAALLEARRIIEPGGTLIVQVPNIASYQARIFGADWFALDVPRHRYHFTRQTLERLMSSCGFEAYRASFYSNAHNAHALKHTLKTRLFKQGRSALKRALFFSVEFMMRPADLLMTVLDEGATLTIAARAL